MMIGHLLLLFAWKCWPVLCGYFIGSGIGAFSYFGQLYFWHKINLVKLLIIESGIQIFPKKMSSCGKICHKEMLDLLKVCFYVLCFMNIITGRVLTVMCRNFSGSQCFSSSQCLKSSLFYWIAHYSDLFGLYINLVLLAVDICPQVITKTAYYVTFCVVFLLL